MSSDPLTKKRIVEVTSVYERIEASPKKVIVNRGGARSSKSYSIIQLFIRRFVNRKNKKILMTRKTMPSLRVTAYRVFVELLKDYGYYKLCKHNKSENTIEYGSNWLLFTSVDDEEKMRSSEFNDIFMEEAPEFTYEDFMTLKLRLSAPTVKEEPNQMFLSFNPSNEYGWINQKLIHQPDVEEIISTYKDNPFLDDEYVKTLEQLQEQDPAYWKIYGLGQYAQLENVIYQPFEVIDSYPDSFDDTIYGLDFGYNNPSALLEIGIKDEEFYTTELLYETKLTNADLIERLKIFLPKGEKRRKEIYADSAEPDRIEEIRRAGFNIKPAYKGKNSVKDGIDFCKSQKIYTLASNVNLNKERSNYTWKQDKNKRALDEPNKHDDHLLDGMRYGITTHTMFKSEVSYESVSKRRFTVGGRKAW